MLRTLPGPPASSQSATFWVLAVRKRPPYGYEDLEELLTELG
jgi:hypothetical protein